MEKLSTILEPFKTATTFMSGEWAPTLHQVVPCIMKLTIVLVIAEEDPALIKKIKVAMKQNLDKRPHELMTFRMASALHPATKQLHFLPEVVRAAVFKELREEAENLDKTLETSDKTRTSRQPGSSPTTSTASASTASPA